MKKIYLLMIAGLLSLPITQEAFSQTDAHTKYKGITIYIDYPDVPASVTPVRLDSLINDVTYQEVGAARSFRKYWYEQSRRNVDFTWKKRSKNQSPADLPERPLLTLFINSRQNSLTTKTSVMMRLSENFNQFLSNLFGDWST